MTEIIECLAYKCVRHLDCSTSEITYICNTPRVVSPPNLMLLQLSNFKDIAQRDGQTDREGATLNMAS